MKENMPFAEMVCEAQKLLLFVFSFVFRMQKVSFQQIISFSTHKYEGKRKYAMRK
jgi:hypothetical protein